ncbi:MAG: SulP family inorganic anion transporter [Vicinamibacteria bacterium]
MQFSFRPRLIEALKAVTRESFFADLSAGITVGIIALPLAMAFAIGSGVKPEAGITTAIVAGFLISALGGTRLAIGGPTGAFIVIVYGIVDRYGVANLVICTLMAGAMLVAMGFFRLGGLIRFVPQPVIVGFTNGIAVLIFLAQIRDFLGLRVEKVPAEFFSMVRTLGAHLDTAQVPAIVMSVSGLLLLRLWPKAWAKYAPAPVVLLLVATAATALLGVPVETIGSRFGGIPRSLPFPALPEVTLAQLRDLIVPAFTIALLAAIESLLCAVVADKMTHDRHDANQELMAQGLANIASGLFGGIPATGAIARTTANIKSGALSPIAGMIHAVTLLLIILIAAPLAKSVPLAALSAILMSVAIDMGEWEVFRTFHTFAFTRNLKLFSVFFVTVLFDLTIAVELGMLISALILIAHIAEVTEVARVGTREPGIAHYRAFGALFFGAAERLEALLEREPDETVVMLDLTHVIYMDTTARAALETLHDRLAKRQHTLLLYGAPPQPARVLQALLPVLGADNVLADREAAFARARTLIARDTRAA